MRSGSSAASTYRPVAAPWAASAPGQHTTVAPNAATARHTPSASHVAAAGVTLRDATQSGRPDVELDGSQQLDATSCALALRDATGAAPPGSAVDVAARVELLHALRRWAGSPEAAASSAHGSPLSADVDSLRRCFLVLSHAWSAADAVDAIALGGGSTQPGGLSAGDVATFLEAAYGAFAALIRSPAWPDGALAVPADWMAALCRRIGNPRSRASEVPHLRDVLYWCAIPSRKCYCVVSFDADDFTSSGHIDLSLNGGLLCVAISARCSPPRAHMTHAGHHHQA